MMSSIFLDSVELSIRFGEKICVSAASFRVTSGDRIALIGPNGEGKSTLLNALMGVVPLDGGKVVLGQGVHVGYLHQRLNWAAERTVYSVACDPLRSQLDGVVRLEVLGEALVKGEPAVAAEYSALLEELERTDAFSAEARIETLLAQMDLDTFRNRQVGTLSGGERMRLGLLQVLALNPQLLLLDEPTNHLDVTMRDWFFRFLDSWQGAAIVITHDRDLLDWWPQRIWRLEGGELQQYEGEYASYLHELEVTSQQEAADYERLRRERRQLGLAVQQEQTRRARTAAYGKRKYEHDKLARKGKKGRAENSMGHSFKKRTEEERERVTEELRQKRRPPRPKPRFHFKSGCGRSGCSLRVRQGSIGYGDHIVADAIDMTLDSGQRMAIVGPNGSGKTTLMRALMGDPEISRKGEWELPYDVRGRCGYLDQHYAYLERELSPCELLALRRPEWDSKQVSQHLDAFLFNDHRDQRRQVAVLSEGQKARLALALIAAAAPDVLVLDEVTNNLDLDTKKHLVEVLRAYPGMLIINSHEHAFLDELGVDVWVQL